MHERGDVLYIFILYTCWGSRKPLSVFALSFDPQLAPNPTYDLRPSLKNRN